MPHDVAATLGVDRHLDGRALLEDALLDANSMGDQLRDRPLRVEHAPPANWSDDLAGVADLAPRLGVERRADCEQLALLASLDSLDRLAVAQQADDDRLVLELVVADELGRR